MQAIELYNGDQDVDKHPKAFVIKASYVLSRESVDLNAFISIMMQHADVHKEKNSEIEYMKLAVLEVDYQLKFCEVKTQTTDTTENDDILD
jgi:hypothetical protein